MQPVLNTLDIVIVVAYCLGMLLLGFYFSRQQHDPKAYLLGDKNIAWWLVLISIVATETSTVTFLSVTGKGFGVWDKASQQYIPGNLTFLQLALGFIVGRCLIAWWLVPLYFRGEHYSAYQVLRQKFGPGVHRLASLVFLVTRIIADGLRLYLAGLFLAGLMGQQLSIHWCILIMGMVTLIYTYLGGIKAIFWTDLVQFCIKVAGAGITLYVVIHWLPGGIHHYWQAMPMGALQIFDFHFDWSQVQTFWAGILGGAFLSMATHGADQMMVQRYLCSRSLTEARLSLISSGVVIFLQFLLFMLVGLGFFLLMQEGLFSVNPEIPPDQVFALFLAGNFIPVGVKGVIVAAVLAAAMSTLSASWNSTASTVVYDFYRPYVPQKTEGQYLIVARFVTLLAGVLQMGIAWLAISLVADRSIIDRVLEIAGLTSGLLLGLFMLGSSYKVVRSRSAVCGLLAGLLLVNLLYWSKYWGYPVAWPWYTPAGAITTWLVGIISDRLLPSSREVSS